MGIFPANHPYDGEVYLKYPIPKRYEKPGNSMGNYVILLPSNLGRSHPGPEEQKHLLGTPTED